MGELVPKQRSLRMRVDSKFLALTILIALCSESKQISVPDEGDQTEDHDTAPWIFPDDYYLQFGKRGDEKGSGYNPWMGKRSPMFSLSSFDDDNDSRIFSRL